MADYAHNYTDKQLEALEKRFQSAYRQAEREVNDKLMDYLHKFKAKDDAKRRLLKEGKITQEEYENWRYGQMMTGKRWKEMRDKLAQEYTSANELAMRALKHQMPDVFAENVNYSTYEIENGLHVDTSFTMYDRQTVDRLLRDNPELLPQPKVDIPKDLRWNRQKIQGAIEQGVLQGESIPKIAKRLRNVTDMNKSAATRNARTAMTGAQNGGRIESYNRAKALGIDLKKCWLATMDGRVRHEHAALDGQTVDTDKPFKMAGTEIMFPGDPSAPGFMVWNCRCTLIAQLKGFEHDVSQGRFSRLENMSYDEWKEYHRNKLTNGKDSGIIYNKPMTLADCKKKEGSYSFSDGHGGVRKQSEAVIYETPDGTRFIFPRRYNKKHQTLTPEMAVDIYGRVPPALRAMGPKTIEIQDVYNPMDTYWKKTYKNFSHSYATGGDIITFWRYDREHNKDYLLETFCHEIGHKVDQDIGNGKRYSQMNKWQKAMADDLLSSGKKSPTKYGENSPLEDFAESIAAYVKDKKKFAYEFGARSKLIKSIFGGNL